LKGDRRGAPREDTRARQEQRYPGYR